MRSAELRAHMVQQHRVTVQALDHGGWNARAKQFHGNHSWAEQDFNGRQREETIDALLDHLNCAHDLNEDGAVIERCESGCNAPVTKYDSEGVPLCQQCWDGLLVSAGILDSLVLKIATWQRLTFPAATAQSVANHLHKEAVELLASPTDAMEIADVFHLLVAACDVNGLSLAQIVKEKFDRNRVRTWGKPDASGVVEHISEGSDAIT